jgi:outer membrane protein TolC
MIIISRSKACGIALLALSLCAGTATAGDITWTEAVAAARAANPALVKARETLDQARWALKRSYANFMPEISANGAVSTDDTGKDYAYGLSGSLSLFAGFANTAQTRSLSYAVHAAESAYERTLSDTLFALRKSFLDLLSAQETVQLSRDILKQREQNYEMIQLKYEAGSEDKGSLLRVDADRIQARYELEKAQRALQTYSLQLAQNMGRDDYSLLTVTGTLASAPAPASIDLKQLIAATPEHRIARDNLSAAEAGITAARSGFLPSLTASAGTSRAGAQWDGGTSSWNTRLALSVPLFAGGKTVYDVKTAVSQKTVAAQTLRQTDQQLASKITGAHTDYIDAADNVAVQDKYTGAAAIQSQISTAKYINGLASYQDWYVIENDYINSRKSLLKAYYNAAVAEAQYKNTLGAGAY